MQQLKIIGLMMLVLLAAGFYWKALNESHERTYFSRTSLTTQQQMDQKAFEESQKRNHAVKEFLQIIRFDDQEKPMRRYFRKDSKTNGYNVYTLYYTNEKQNKIWKFVSMKMNADGIIVSFKEHEF